jgi:hypothetical protein
LGQHTEIVIASSVDAFLPICLLFYAMLWAGKVSPGLHRHSVHYALNRYIYQDRNDF